MNFYWRIYDKNIKNIQNTIVLFMDYTTRADNK